VKKHKLSGIDQITAELIQVGSKQYFLRLINLYFE